MDKKVRRMLKKHFRDFIDQNSYGSTTDENAEVRAILDRCLVDGKIGVVLTGRDCDCVAYSRSYVMDQVDCVAAFKRHWFQHCDWLDGPESQHFVRPEQIDRSTDYSRDLVMEAYEDGHPHHIYA